MRIHLEHKAISVQYEAISVSDKPRPKKQAKKQATNLRLSGDVQRAGPYHSPPPCPPKVVNTTLLSLTLKSTLEGASEKLMVGETSGCVRSHRPSGYY